MARDRPSKPLRERHALIGFLHTSPVHVPTFDRLTRSLLPDTETTHLVDEGLLAEARQTGPTEALRLRVRDALSDLAARGPAVIACTCSTLGSLTDDAAASLGITVLRGDRTMAERAVALASQRSGRIGVAVALVSTLEPTTTLLEEVAKRAGHSVIVTVIPCFDAWSAFEAQDMDEFARVIATHVRAAAAEVDVIMLAQPSMAVAAPLLDNLPVPVLSSPALLVESMANALGSDADLLST